MDRDDELAYKVHLHNSSDSDDFPSISSVQGYQLVNSPILNINPSMCVKVPANSRRKRQKNQNANVNSIQSYNFPDPIPKTKRMRTRKKKLILEGDGVPEINASKDASCKKENKGKNKQAKLLSVADDFSKNKQKSTNPGKAYSLQDLEKTTHKLDNKNLKTSNSEYVLDSFKHGIDFSKFPVASSSNQNSLTGVVNVLKNSTMLTPCHKIQGRQRNKQNKSKCPMPKNAGSINGTTNQQIQQNRQIQQNFPVKVRQSMCSNVKMAASTKSDKPCAAPQNKKKLDTVIVTKKNKSTNKININATGKTGSKQNESNKQISKRKDNKNKMYRKNNITIQNSQRYFETTNPPLIMFQKVNANTVEVKRTKTIVADSNAIFKKLDKGIDKNYVESSVTVLSEHKTATDMCLEEIKQPKTNLNLFECNKENAVKHSEEIKTNFINIDDDNLFKFFDNQKCKLLEYNDNYRTNLIDKLTTESDDSSVLQCFVPDTNIGKVADQNIDTSTECNEMFTETSKLIDLSSEDTAKTNVSFNTENCLINLWDTIENNAVNQASIDTSNNNVDSEIEINTINNSIDTLLELFKKPIKYRYSKDSLLKIQENLNAAHSFVIDHGNKIPEILLKNGPKLDTSGTSKKKKKKTNSQTTNKQTQTIISIPVEEKKLYYEDFEYRSDITEDKLDMTQEKDNEQADFTENLFDKLMTILYIYLFFMFLIDGVMPLLVLFFNFSLMFLFFIGIYKCFV